ncbi:OmpA family protein [Aestuariivirga sp.]|uniref:OmpA family protein n=1 Tax=Aestuariivirga sp. TaxID=2650926 RepID=UPI003592FB41
MKLSPLHASLVALALFGAVTTSHAAKTGIPGSIVVAQADDNGTGGDAAIQKFLAGGRNLSKLDEGRLQQRLNRAQRLKKTPNLSADLSSQLDQEISQINTELASRKQAGGTQTQAESGNAGSQPAAENTSGGKKNQQQAGTSAGSADIDSFLKSVQPVSGLNDKDLRTQMRKAAELSRTQGISGPQRKQLREVVRESRAEMQKRGGGNGNGNGQQQGAKKQNGTASQDAAGGKKKAQQTADGAQGNGDVGSFLGSARPVAGLNDKDLRSQMRKAAQLSKAQGVSPEQRKQLRDIVREGRAEMDRRKTGGTAQQGGTGQTGNQQQTGEANQPAGDAKVDQASEQKARALLTESAPANMDKAARRKRVDSMRELLASDQLSPATKNELRQRLATERDVLRGGNGDTTNVVVNNNTVINNTDVKVVINDRRPGRDLRDEELHRRINVFSVVINDNSYNEAERRRWRLALEQDRLVLRDRLIAQRRVREARLRSDDIDINIDLGLVFRPGRPLPPRYVYAAEAEEQELVEALAAPPRRAIERRYSMAEVESDPGLRDAVSRIEIDTVNFGFGEGFLREEEVDNLDRIAEIMEKILTESPGEVFMIEGHTDAVGTEGANLQLSRQRADAVKEALTTYYVIPEENLETAGFGERYLKIPTPEPEVENRRVSIARITPLVGALE